MSTTQMRIAISVLVISGLLTGCAASNIACDYTLDSKRRSSVATGTITYSGDYAYYRLHIYNEQSGDTYRIEHGDSQTLNPILAFKGEAINPELHATGSAFAVELPAGSYVIRSWQVSQGAANVTGWRFNLLAVMFLLAGSMIVIQLVILQFSPERSEFVYQGDLYSRTLHIFYPPRGDIYDRWGRLLAGSTLVYEVGAQVDSVENADTIAFALSKVLTNHPEYDYPEYSDQIYSVIHRAEISGTAYVQLADFVTPEELSQLQDWAQNYSNLPDVDYGEVGRPSLSGLVYRPRLQRYYPEDLLGANILGFVNRETVVGECS